jgi:hypothetical protein
MKLGIFVSVTRDGLDLPVTKKNVKMIVSGEEYAIMELVNVLMAGKAFSVSLKLAKIIAQVTENAQN